MIFLSIIQKSRLLLLKIDLKDIKTFGNIKTYKISVKNHIDYYNF